MWGLLQWWETAQVWLPMWTVFYVLVRVGRRVIHGKNADNGRLSRFWRYLMRRVWSV